jgi:hypothetical protein
LIRTLELLFCDLGDTWVALGGGGWWVKPHPVKLQAALFACWVVWTQPGGLR